MTNISHESISDIIFQVEDTFQEGQEKEEQQDKGNIKAEDNAIEMSEDFEGQMHDGDENEPGDAAHSFFVLFHFWFCLLAFGSYC